MKRNWKRTMALILALVMSCASTIAWAAPGDAALFIGEEGGSTVYIYDAQAVGDVAYMLEDDGIYVIQVGEKEAREYKFPENEEENYDGYRIKLFARDGKLMGLNGANGELYELSFEGETVSFTKTGTLDWDMMTYGEGEDKYPRDIATLLFSNDTLYINAYDEEYDNKDLMAFNMTDGSGRVIGQVSASELLIGRDGALWASVYDEEDWEQPLTLCNVSLEDGTLTEIVKLADNSSCGLAYDAEQDRVIYSSNGTVYATAMDGTLSELASIPMSSFGGDQGGAGLLDGGYYFVSGYEGTVIKNLDQQYKPSRTLKIRCSYMENDQAYFTFTEAHPEAAIKVLTGNGDPDTDEVTQAMMNGSSEVDIYLLNVSSAAYQALMGRGYAADISSSATLADMANRMYPVFQNVLMKDGKLLAFPKDVNANCQTINTKLAEELGLEELPDSWDDLLDLVEKWDEEYSKEFPEKAMFDPYETANMKETLFTMLLNAYVVRMNQPGQELTINTPTMRNLLARLDSMSFAAFASDQDFSNGYSWNSDDVLIDSWGTVLPSNGYNYYREEETKPLLLALSDDEEALLDVTMSVYVVNPYSENIDLAIAYLEARAQTMNEGLSATLLSDWTEPIRDPYFDENMKWYDERIADVEKALSQAADDEKQMYEESLSNLQQGRQNLMDNEFTWTEEDLAEYRELTNRLVVMQNYYFNSYSGEEAAEEMQQLISRYVDGQMSAEQMLSAMDQKLKMMQMESAY